MSYPVVAYPELVGSYDVDCCSGGGGRYDRVLEYRVWSKGPTGWCLLMRFSHPADLLGCDYDPATTHLVALVEQDWYFNCKGEYVQMRRVTEWDINWLEKRTMLMDMTDEVGTVLGQTLCSVVPSACLSPKDRGT